MKKSDPWEQRQGSNTPREHESRSEWERDFARIIHSPSFRRLQGKTQVLGMGDSDFYRTRLTHSMEVAQVSAALVSNIKKRLREKDSFTLCEVTNIPPLIVYVLLPDAHLSSAIGLAHDLGHPPYGHGGEVALNYCMRKHGGFEGNGQTLRILSRLEKYVDGYGLNPTRRLLLGVLKYPVAYSDALAFQNIRYPEPTSSLPWLIKRKDYIPPKCYLDTESDIVSWTLVPFPQEERRLFRTPYRQDDKVHHHMSLDASLMEIADDICYSVHDLEDAIALGLVSREKFTHIMEQNECTPLFLHELDRKLGEIFQRDDLETMEDTLHGLFNADTCVRKEKIGRLIHLFISACRLKEKKEFTPPLLRLNAELPEPFATLQKALGKVVKELVILSPGVQQLEFKGQRIVIELFEALSTDPERFLPESTKNTYLDTGGEEAKMRVICDYVAGMTDEYAAKVYERIFCPHHGSVFDRL